MSSDAHHMVLCMSEWGCLQDRGNTSSDSPDGTSAAVVAATGWFRWHAQVTWSSSFSSCMLGVAVEAQHLASLDVSELLSDAPSELLRISARLSA